MKTIRTILVGAAAAAVLAASTACAPVSTAESLTVTLTPGRCIAVKHIGHTQINTVCNWSKITKSYWYPYGTQVWYV